MKNKYDDIFVDFSELTELTPYRASFSRPTAKIDSRGQLILSAAFSQIIEKSKDDPLGKYRHIRCAWGYDPEWTVLSDFDSEKQEAIRTNIGILHLQFQAEPSFDSIEVTSRYPKNVIGIKSIFQYLADTIPANEIGIQPMNMDDEDGEILGEYDFVTVKYLGPSHNIRFESHWKYRPLVPPDGETYIFQGLNIKTNRQKKRVALIWTSDTFGNGNSEDNTGVINDEKPPANEQVITDNFDDIPF